MQRQITINAAKVSPSRWLIFADNADLSEYEPEIITAWIFDYKLPDTGRLIDVNEAITKFDLTKDNEGRYISPAAASLAYEIAYANTHINSVAGPNVHVVPPITKATIGQIPHEILTAFVRRTDPTSVTTVQDIASLKKKKPASDNSQAETAGAGDPGSTNTNTSPEAV